MLNDIQKHILEVVAGMRDGKAKGAVNIRECRFPEKTRAGGTIDASAGGRTPAALKISSLLTGPFLETKRAAM